MAEDNEDDLAEDPKVEKNLQGKDGNIKNINESKDHISAQEPEKESSPAEDDVKDAPASDENISESTQNKIYWKTNLIYLSLLLSIWFIVSYGFGILFADALDSIRIGGFKLGFWFAQQGSIYVFVILIFVYVKLMNKLDKKYMEEKN